MIELDLMNAKQKAALPDDEEVTAADRLIVVAPENAGIVLMRALSRERGARDEVKRRMDAATCGAAS